MTFDDDLTSLFIHCSNSSVLLRVVFSVSLSLCLSFSLSLDSFISSSSLSRLVMNFYSSFVFFTLSIVAIKVFHRREKENELTHHDTMDHKSITSSKTKQTKRDIHRINDER